MDAKKMKVSDFPKRYLSFLGKTDQKDSDIAFCQWASTNEIASEFNVSHKDAHLMKCAAYK